MGHAANCAHDAVQRIASLWQVESSQSRWIEPNEQDAGGFDWWPGDFCVRIRAQLHRTAENPLCRIVIRTDFLKDVAIDERFETLSATTSRFMAPTYAWVYPPQLLREKYGLSVSDARFWLGSSGYVSPDSIGWMPDLLAGTCIVQPINAQIQAQAVCEILGSGTPDNTRPAELADCGLDQILGALEHAYVPVGEQPSRWVGTGEFEKFAAEWARSDVYFSSAGPTEMSLETPFGKASALIRFLTDEKHPQLGHGLLVTLQLPDGGHSLAVARHAAELNFLEAASWTGFPQLGCWHGGRDNSGQDRLAFTFFVPNLLYKPGLATNFAFWFLSRARWAREHLFPGARDLPMIDILRRRTHTNRRDADGQDYI